MLVGTTPVTKCGVKSIVMSIGALSAKSDNTRFFCRSSAVAGSKHAEHKPAVQACLRSGDVSESASKEHISECFMAHGVSSLWYIAHRDNIDSIMAHGIKNHQAVTQLGMKCVDISSSSVQRWREQHEPIYQRKIHEYTPCYINPLNPMSYALRARSSELCLMEISLSVLTAREYIISDGNAASRDTCFFDSVDDLNQLPCDALNTKYWSNIPDGKRKRCSEVLVCPDIEAKHIKTIHCCSLESVRYLSSKQRLVKMSPGKFF